jgi:hypothetical protein
MSPYGIAVHEAAHSVVATLFQVPWRVVYARQRHGALLPDSQEMQGLLDADPEGNWPQQAFAMVSLAGPIAEARWVLNMGSMHRGMAAGSTTLRRTVEGLMSRPPNGGCRKPTLGTKPSRMMSSACSTRTRSHSPSSAWRMH